MSAQSFVQFVTEGASPFHAVSAAKKRLLEFGFVEVNERATWNNVLKPGGKYFFTRNQSALVAFGIGKLYKPGNGFSVIGAHTDSPCLKLKPISRRESNGYLQVGVQTYGGGLWHTWFDRDLGVAGRVVVKSKSSNGSDVLESRLVKINKPILRIPSLAIHLDRSVKDAFNYNTETHLTPILATALKAGSSSEGDHHKIFMGALKKELQLKDEQEEIIDFELCLFDTQPSCIGGICDEFILSPRLDNLFMSFTSFEALIKSIEKDQLKDEENIRMIALFDNEEVGSETANGAASYLMESTMRRLASEVSTESKASMVSFDEAIHKSFLISADMAHAIHPNYAEKHESKHQPHFHKGIVVKTNANQRYATNSLTAAVLKQVAASKTLKQFTNGKDIPLQEFVVKNDSPCGSTIGPIMSAKLGVRTIDVGCPQLSMHSIREMAAVDDLDHAINLFTAFFLEFPNIDRSIKLQ